MPEIATRLGEPLSPASLWHDYRVTSSLTANFCTMPWPSAAPICPLLSWLARAAVILMGDHGPTAVEYGFLQLPIFSWVTSRWHAIMAGARLNG